MSSTDYIMRGGESPVELLNPLISQSCGDTKRTQRSFAPLHAPKVETGEAKLARDAKGILGTPQTPAAFRCNSSGLEFRI